MKTLKNRLVIISCLLITLTTFSAFKTYKALQTPIEKIYTQTDRSFYFPGETLWFKSYLVTNKHRVSELSDIIHAQLISPKGAVVKSLKLSVKDGYVYGSFDINQNWVGGIYTLKMYTNWMRNFGEDTFFEKKITVQKVVKPNLLLNLDFEKEGYGKASEVVSEVDIKDLKNNPLKDTEITFKVTAKGQQIISETTTTNDEGKAKPSFTLPEDLSTTDVVLNVLIPYKGSTESISKSVPVVLDNIDLQFFPESGKIIAGTTNVIAFKAINEFTKPVDVSGDILDSKGEIITSFSSFHDGMGSLTILAKPNETYTAKLKSPFVSERDIKLPKVNTQGTRFSVETNKSAIKINLFSTERKALQLEISNASELLFEKRIYKNTTEIAVNTENYPMGITKISVKTQSGQILAERLVFINAHKQVKVDITLDKVTYKIREKVKLSITTTDLQGKGIPSNLSIAVADNKLLSFADDKQDHILSYFLLSSELKGKIHKPYFYLNPEEKKSSQALDYLMLTHGWRNHIANPLVTINNAKYMPEQHTTQSGVIVDKNDNPISAHLLLMDSNGNEVLVFDTKEDGTFSFKFIDNRSLILIAYRDDKKTLKIKTTSLNEGYYSQKEKDLKTPENEVQLLFNTNSKPLQNKIKNNAAIASVSLSEDSQLEEVVVMGYRTQHKSNSSAASVTVTSESIENRPNASFIQTLTGQTPGLKITQSSGQPGGNSLVQLRGVGSITGNSEPLFIVDGVPVDENVFKNLNTSNIEAITILKDAGATAIYGSRGRNGVIVITSKSGDYINNYHKKTLNNRRFNNYAFKSFSYRKPSNIFTPVEFYVPKYEEHNDLEERTDFRQTVYWNPVVQTDGNGKAELEFYNSDAITSFKVTAEGVGFNGILGRQEKTYSTKKMLNIDFKMPNYMALEDVVKLPLTITNETSTTIKAHIEVVLPEHLKFAEDYDKQVSVNAHSSVLRTVTVIPIKKVENTSLEIRVNSETLNDVVKKDVTILSPYFPIETSVSGSKSQAYEFEINSIIEGSLTADFNIYTDVIGDVMNGIESLIRQPYGCFEQTSSSTYPNILVLQYLKESGKINPDIEAKALDFIDQGYKRLISFETKEGGFEWFGKTPPHETLTAYGILEFTEMKDVYNKVDQNMINRTVDWLMSRKDGKGGFHKSKRGYDSFASSPQDVANAYIVYALSEAGIEVDMNLEYETAVKDALQSNDAYKIAMMALASDNFEHIAYKTQLLKALKDLIFRYEFKGLPVDNTITRSYGNAKNIEVNAFALLALMRDTTADEFLINKGIEYLVSLRKNNRFGSTQSTAMALKALIEYTKIQKGKIIQANNTVELVINGQKLHKKLEVNPKGLITIKNLESYFKKGKQHVQINFNNEKTTFPYCLTLNYDSYVPNSSNETPLKLKTKIDATNFKVGDNVSLTIDVVNTKEDALGMVTSIIGIPSGTTAQPWQLKALLEEKKVAYYEIFDNYIVFYWRAFKPEETKSIRLDLKADIAGDYQAPASTAYLYYGDEFKTWEEGNTIKILN